MTLFPDDANGHEADTTEPCVDSEHTTWENQPRGGWDEFRRARNLLLLDLAVDSALRSAPGEDADA